MKWFFGILAVVGAGALGYVTEPALREDLTGVSSKAVATPDEPVEATPVEETAPPEPEVPAPVETPAVEPEPAVEPPPAPADELPAGEMASLDPGPAEEAVPEPAAEEAPADEPAAEETPQPAASGDVVAVMQQSIRASEIKEFTFDQVKDWQPGEDESVDGATFQTGLVTYEAETPLGTRAITAKAFIRNGKVERWIWPKSGMEIK